MTYGHSKKGFLGKTFSNLELVERLIFFQLQIPTKPLVLI